MRKKPPPLRPAPGRNEGGYAGALFVVLGVLTVGLLLLTVAPGRPVLLNRGIDFGAALLVGPAGVALLALFTLLALISLLTLALISPHLLAWLALILLALTLLTLLILVVRCH